MTMSPDETPVEFDPASEPQRTDIEGGAPPPEDLADEGRPGEVG